MKRICFVGSSQVGALKQALSVIEDDLSSLGVEAACFATHGDSIYDLEVNDGIIFPTSETARENFSWTGGNQVVELREYTDVVWVAGPHPLYFAQYVKSPTPISQPLLDAAMYEAIHTKMNSVFIQSADSSTARHWLLGNPLRSENCPVYQKLKAKAGKDSNFLYRLKEQLDTGLSSLRKKVPFEIIEPEQSLLDEAGLATRDCFSRGSLKMLKKRKPHSDGDFGHMNQDYGEVMLRKVANCVLSK